MQGQTQFCSAQWARPFKWKYIPPNSWVFMVFSWTFVGRSTRAFIAPCLRPRKGLRIVDDKRIVIHCERTCCYYVFDDCESLMAFLTAQKKDNSEFLNFHEVIHGQSYQKLRFDVDAPVEFLEQIMPDFEKPKLDAEPAKPKPTGLNLIDDLELGLYEEKLAEVRHYNDYVNNTSLNMWRGVHIMTHINMAIKKAFEDFYSGRIDPLFDIHDMYENFLVFDSSNETKFSRHVIIPGFHVQNYHEAKAFADEVVRNLDAKFCPAIDLGVY